MSQSTHHSFSLEVAEEYGIEAAILIHHFQHWINKNMRKDRNSCDGRTWTYQTLDDMHANFPYLTKDKLRDTLDLLSNGKTRKMKGNKIEPVLVIGNYNKTKFDRTLWYAFTDEKKWTIKESITKRDKAKIQVGYIPDGNGIAPTPIPDTKTNTKTNTKEEGQVSTKLAVSFFNLLLKENPKHRKPNMTTWSNDMGKLLREGRTESEIIEVMTWSIHHEFWGQNILSPGKLYKQFDALIKKKGCETKSMNTRPSHIKDKSNESKPDEIKETPSLKFTTKRPQPRED